MTTGWKILIGAACVTIIVVGGWWIITEMQMRRETSELADALKLQEDSRDLAECRTIVGAWDSGDRRPGKAKYGSAAKNGVGFCRALIEIDRVERKN